MQLSADGTSIHLQIDASLTASEIDALIRKLALARAAMTPSIPGKRLDTSVDSVLVENGQPIEIAQRRDGGFRLWTRHRGLGWLAWEFDDRFARGLADFITHRTPKADAVDLISTELSQRH